MMPIAGARFCRNPNLWPPKHVTAHWAKKRLVRMEKQSSIQGTAPPSAPAGQAHRRFYSVRNGFACGAGILSEAAWSAVAASLGLSLRELGIVRGIFDNRTEPNIADDLGISIHTVHTHVARMRRKLGVTGHVSLVLRIMNEFLKLTVSPARRLPPICSLRAAGLCQRRD